MLRIYLWRDTITAKAGIADNISIKKMCMQATEWYLLKCKAIGAQNLIKEMSIKGEKYSYPVFFTLLDAVEGNIKRKEELTEE